MKTETNETKTQHTPGPWKVSRDGNDIENVEGAGVCALYADETDEANATLIAAAPELLETLKEFVDYGESYANYADKRIEPYLKQARAAIAKATG